MERKKIPYLNVIPILLIGFLLFRLINHAESVDWVFNVLNPFLWAFTIAYLLNPIMQTIEKYLKLSRGWSILITYIIVLGLLVFVITIITPNIVESIGNLVSNMPNYVLRTQIFLEKNRDKLEFLEHYGITTFFEDKVADVLEKISNNIAQIVNEVLTQAINVTSVLLKAIVSLTISVYFLKDKENFAYKIKKALYAGFDQDKARRIINLGREVDTIFSRYLIGKLIDSMIIGIICFMTLKIISTPYALLISVIVGVTNMIPYFGPIIGAVPAVSIVLFINPIKALWVAVVILVLQQVDGLLLGPFILGEHVGVKPFWIITAIVVGGAVFGVVGMLIGVPMVAVIKLLLERYIDQRLKEKNIRL